MRISKLRQVLRGLPADDQVICIMHTYGETSDHAGSDGYDLDYDQWCEIVRRFERNPGLLTQFNQWLDMQIAEQCCSEDE